MAQHDGPKRKQKIVRADGVEATYTVGSDTPDTPSRRANVSSARATAAAALDDTAANPHPSARIQGSDYTHIAEAVSRLDTPERRERYLRGDFTRADRANDIDTRYRWDLFWEADGGRLYDSVPEGADDTHLDTTLRSIVPPLQTHTADSTNHDDTPPATVDEFQQHDAGHLQPGDEIILPGDIPGTVQEFRFSDTQPDAVEVVTDNGSLHTRLSEQVWTLRRPDS